MTLDETNAENSAPEVRSNGGTAPPSATPPKRGPGRPRKDQTAGAAPLGETPVGASEAPKRGRPKKERVELDKTAVARQLFGSHVLVANMLGLPEFAISEKEADSLADAVIEFSREHDFEPDPKLMASINLLATVGMVYVPRVTRVAARIKRAKAARGQTIDGTATEVKPADATPAS